MRCLRMSAEGGAGGPELPSNRGGLVASGVGFEGLGA